MRGLARVREVFSAGRPLAGWTVLLHMHLTRETLALGEVLAAGGACPVFLPSNRNPAPDAVCRDARGLGVLLDSLGEVPGAIGTAQTLVVEGNGRVFEELHRDPPSPLDGRVAGISEHTSGGGRIVDRFDPSGIRVPVVAVYNDPLKAELETGLGTSQTVLAALLRGLGRPVAGRRAVVIGYGNVGRGVARCLRILGARVTVVETAGAARLQARLAGFPLADLANCLPEAELCLTTTGSDGVITADHLAAVREGLVLANVSNRPKEIDLAGCDRIGAEPPEAAGPFSFWSCGGGPVFGLLGGGLQVNHVLEEGNPEELMDLSFTLHALVLRWLAAERPAPGLHPIPDRLRQAAAELVLGGRS
ncbi:MAG TPA: NAD(P)-dependent oxidoreductase [Thermoanaerobaculia bacterium]|jgi:adenosylhomocysteinase|nr:NAD(P)-dependent oxidoreductase [Thermoanaerobaculia bacterium]